MYVRMCVRTISFAVEFCENRFLHINCSILLITYVCTYICTYLCALIESVCTLSLAIMPGLCSLLYCDCSVDDVINLDLVLYVRTYVCTYVCTALLIYDVCSYVRTLPLALFSSSSSPQFLLHTGDSFVVPLKGHRPAPDLTCEECDVCVCVHVCVCACACVWYIHTCVYL